MVGAAATGIVYGCVRLHSSPHAPSNGTGEEQRNALLEKGWGREIFAAGEQGAQEHEEAFMEYLSGNFDDAGSEVRSLEKGGGGRTTTHDNEPARPPTPKTARHSERNPGAHNPQSPGVIM